LLLELKAGKDCFKRSNISQQQCVFNIDKLPAKQMRVDSTCFKIYGRI